MSHTDALSVRELVADAVDVLRAGDVVLGGPEIDYAVANMLEVLGAIHDDTGIDLEEIGEVREVARLVIEGWPL